MKSEIRSGIALGLVFFLWLLLEYFLGLHTTNIDYHPLVSWLFIVIVGVGINWALKAKRDRYFGGKITFFQAFKTGLFITLVMTIVSPLMHFFYTVMVNPMYFDTMLAHSQQMIEELNVDEVSKAKMLTRAMNENTLLYTMGNTAIVLFVSGFVMSFFASLLIKRNVNPKPAAEETPSVDQVAP